MLGIVTHYEVHNHGAQLQLYALLQVLRHKGFEAAALTFKKDYRYLAPDAERKYRISIKSLPFYTRYLMHNGIRKMLFNVQKKRIFDRFRNRNGMLGERYESFGGELIIVGSDEVFSTEVGITDAFWGVGAPCQTVVSYAASFGPTTLAEIERKQERAYISAALRCFKRISVRDKNSAFIVNELIGHMPEKVCDPVILYGYKQEIEKQIAPFHGQKYLLLYSYDKNMNTAEEIQMIRRVASSLNLPVYSVGFYHDWCDKNINVSPIELLGYFKHAQYVITDTFHGTVLSLITESVFAAFIRGNANKLCNLLEEYDLLSRRFSTAAECMQILTQQIDYTTVRVKMESYRKASMQFLDSVVEQLHEQHS